MTIDAHKNFAYTAVATAPSPATSGTSLLVVAGKGVLFPTAPFNVVVWPTGVPPIGTNAEILRVTGVSTDTFTITRAQEGTTARTVIVGDQIALTPTTKMFTDIETAIAALQAVKIQSGIETAVSAGDNTVTFSVAFASAPVVVSAVGVADDLEAAAYTGVWDVSATDFHVSHTAGGTRDIHWIAVGV